MRSEPGEYNEDQARLPNPCYDRLRGPSGHNGAALPKSSLTSAIAFGLAWMFGLEALLSDDESPAADASHINGPY
ncbi:hypothetical protein J8I87_18555 [Paraburkholderia sp. LEh10]|uniref:hypothetical protein n=1 Tax=Paraburkholderia sp. LEh10 TaxID=2821353 RepID=UPI001AE1CCE3|nr:hypothetical protein [Paraburkholderia sp. LEh10]MBP0591694.1 hypothetical protein [Paraburkholderia sp. LEh10]